MYVQDIATRERERNKPYKLDLLQPSTGCLEWMTPIVNGHPNNLHKGKENSY